MTPQEQILALQGQVALLTDELKRALSANYVVLEQVKKLEAQVLLLLEELERKKPPKKDSRNSSMPPSSDMVPVKKNLREQSTRPNGGQEGHKGHTLLMSKSPDKVIDLQSSYCERCGTSLGAQAQVLKMARQVVEIPPVQPIYAEYRQYGCNCPGCGHEQVAAFPAGVNAPIQYGSSVEALLSYFSVYQYVPFKRLQDLLAQVFSLPLSQGTIANILERSAQKCSGVYERIKQDIADSSVVGADETGAKVNGDKWWIWVWQNLRSTFIVASDTRAAKTIDKVWVNGLPNAMLVSDRLPAQLKTAVKGHQLCLAHLLRELLFLEDAEAHPFSTRFREIIAAVFDTRKTLITAYTTGAIEAIEFERKVDAALAIMVDTEKSHKTAVFQASMIKYRDYLLPCLYDLAIPPDNNGSERAIRNVKVKQKVSGQFKSGQHAFCVIRSVVDTLRKRQLDVLPYLAQIINLQPE